MILSELEPKIDDKSYGEVYPRYGGQSLVNVPHTIMQALGISTHGIPIDRSLYKDHVDLDGINKVALVLLDGLGYNMWQEASNNAGFFETFTKRGTVMPITSVFPSTTAASITTLNTGLQPIEHGLPEWQVYYREINTIINTLPFTPFYPQAKKGLRDMGADPKILYDGTTVYDELVRNKVECVTMTNRSIASGAYTEIIKHGSRSMPYVNASDGIVRLRKQIESAKRDAYIQLYIDNIDSSSHMYGPLSDESRAETESISHSLKSQLLDRIGRTAAEETLILVTADHGHTKIDPASIIYLNGDKKLAGMLDTEKGRKILPTGSPRDVFLHIKDGKIDDALSYLRERFSGTARVLAIEEAISMGLFGTGRQAGKFRDRIGDILLLPKDHSAIWYEHIPGRKYSLVGVHGGLSFNEMVIPLGMARLSDLI